MEKICSYLNAKIVGRYGRNRKNKQSITHVFINYFIANLDNRIVVFV